VVDDERVIADIRPLTLTDVNVSRSCTALRSRPSKMGDKPRRDTACSRD
jgi:hypothetical protein